MTPRTKAQFEEIRVNRKQQIIYAGLELFARDGYGHVSIATLAKHAGISKGLLYNYFESKEQLLKEILSEGMDEIMEYFDPNHDGKLTQEEFILFIKRTFKIMHENKDFWLKMFGIIIQPNVAPLLKNSALVKFMNQYLEILENYFREQGFEDPFLEVIHLSVIIEGLAIVLTFYDGLSDIPPDIFKKFETRIINQYTKKNEKN